MTNGKDNDTYTIKGKRYIRVTALLKARGLIDFSSIPGNDRDFYLERGTQNHLMWQMVEEGKADGFDFDHRVEAYRAAHARFLRETGFCALPGGIEMRVSATWEDLGLPGIRGGEEYAGIAGTLDRLGIIQNRMVLIDYKSGSIPSSCAIQTAIYLLCIHGYKFGEVERYGVGIRHNGTYRMSARYPFGDRDEAMYHISEFRKTHK